MNNTKRSGLTILTGAIFVFITISLATGAWAYELQSSNANSVRVDILPVQLSPGKPANFEIRLNTHSVPLDYDLVAVSLLKDDQGREYRASVWSGSQPGGHHRSGILEFPVIAKDAKAITLYLKNIADVPERTFEWKLEQYLMKRNGFDFHRNSVVLKP